MREDKQMKANELKQDLGRKAKKNVYCQGYTVSNQRI